MTKVNWHCTSLYRDEREGRLLTPQLLPSPNFLVLLHFKLVTLVLNPKCLVTERCVESAGLAVIWVCQMHLIDTSYLLQLISFRDCSYRLGTLIRLPLKSATNSKTRLRNSLPQINYLIQQCSKTFFKSLINPALSHFTHIRSTFLHYACSISAPSVNLEIFARP